VFILTHIVHSEIHLIQFIIHHPGLPTPASKLVTFNNPLSAHSSARISIPFSPLYPPLDHQHLICQLTHLPRQHHLSHLSLPTPYSHAHQALIQSLSSTHSPSLFSFKLMPSYSTFLFPSSIPYHHPRPPPRPAPSPQYPHILLNVFELGAGTLLNITRTLVGQSPFHTTNPITFSPPTFYTFFFSLSLSTHQVLITHPSSSQTF